MPRASLFIFLLLWVISIAVFFMSCFSVRASGSVGSVQGYASGLRLQRQVILFVSIFIIKSIEIIVRDDCYARKNFKIGHVEVREEYCLSLS